VAGVLVVRGVPFVGPSGVRSGLRLGVLRVPGLVCYTGMPVVGVVA
jgi:hypothetical protein